MHFKRWWLFVLYLICNPTAGNGRSAQIGKSISQKLKALHIAHMYEETQYPGHATLLATEAVRLNAATCVAIGGDGTTLEVARGLVNHDTALGIIPAGTGNDFIKTIHLPANESEALKAILNLPPKKTDVVKMNDRIFLNEAGAGFDVMVLEYALKAKKYCRGLLPYLYGVLCTIFHFGGVTLTYALDDDTPIEKRVLVIGIGNGRFIGGGIPITPEAVPDDGLLDVIIVSSMKKLRMLSVLPGLMRGNITKFKETEYHRVKKLSLKGDNLHMNIDGEIIPISEVHIAVLPGALNIHRP